MKPARDVQSRPQRCYSNGGLNAALGRAKCGVKSKYRCQFPRFCKAAKSRFLRVGRKPPQPMAVMSTMHCRGSINDRDAMRQIWAYTLVNFGSLTADVSCIEVAQGMAVFLLACRFT
jgi:hypothetical protein